MSDIHIMKTLLAFGLFGICMAWSACTLAQQGAPADASPAASPAVDKTEAVIPEIQIAARDGNLGRVRSLIAAGTDVDAKNHNGRTALMSAVYFQNKAVIRELLGDGADVNVQDSSGRTALMIAVMSGSIDIAKALLAAGADVKIADQHKKTVLDLAEKSSLDKARKKELSKLLESAAE